MKERLLVEGLCKDVSRLIISTYMVYNYAIVLYFMAESSHTKVEVLGVSHEDDLSSLHLYE